ncbi:26S proteasome non-ATPase regulatory subunit 8 -like protein A [Capsicum chinense]|nr:26S proteasome non-ATPase regulatory subunit 8 -like protein A [Capsicum chinense]
MDPKFTEVSQTFERFKAAFVREDFDTCTRLLCQLKVLLTAFTSLPPLFQETSNAIDELTIARDIYEHAVVLSVKMEDQDAFERDFFQLKPYYTDARGRLESSPKEYSVLGLNLLRLLVQNRIAEFHTELELLSQSALDNPCIKHAVELEQSFMEGAYHRVLSARQTAPDVTYDYFMDLLAKTVRAWPIMPIIPPKDRTILQMSAATAPCENKSQESSGLLQIHVASAADLDEIAGCSEKAYDRLSTSDARQMLLFSSDKELLQYVEQEHPEWEIKGGFIIFQKVKDSVPCKEIPSLQLITQTLSYARELERIV